MRTGTAETQPLAGRGSSPSEASDPQEDDKKPRVPILSLMRRVITPSGVIMVLVALLIAWLALGPLVLLVWETITVNGELSLQAIIDAYSAPRLFEMIVNTFVFSVGATLLAVGSGTLLAYLTARTNMPFKGLAVAASLVPLVIPQVLYAIAWIFLGSPRIGLINAWLEPIFGPGTMDIFSMAGMILVEGLHLAPLVYLLMYAAFKNMDPSLEESAMMSGASRFTTAVRITAPLARPAFLASFLIMFIRAIEAFEVPALIGLPDGIFVFMSRIWRALTVFPPDQAEAGSYAIGILLVTALGLYGYSKMTAKGGASYQTVTGKGFRSHAMDLGVWRWPAATLTLAYFVIAVLLPLFILIYASLRSFYVTPTWGSMTNLTLMHYAELLSRPTTLTAFRNSIFLSIGTATAVMIVMAVASWMVIRTKVRGRWLVDLLAFLPFAIPGLILGMAFLIIYLRVPIPIYGTIWILFLAYFTRFMPYGMRYVSTSMHQIAHELEESAQVSGATWLQTFRKVLLPLILPGMIAGWIYIASVSLRELSSSLLLYSPGNEVLSIEIWRLWENGNLPGVAALGVMMMVLLMVMVAIARRVGSRLGVNEF